MSKKKAQTDQNTHHSQNLKLTQATNEPKIKRKQTDQIQKIKNIIIAQ